MNFYLVSEKDYINNLSKLDDFEFNDMPIEARETYLLLYSFYHALFCDYILKKTKILEYEEQLSDSELSFLPVADEDKDIYQSMVPYLRYIYIRNNIHIQNLTNEERSFLAEKLSRNETLLDDELEDFIERTFGKVISENSQNDGVDEYTSFGPFNLQFMAPSNAIVIGIRYDEFNYNGKTDSEWAENHEKQQEYISKISSELKTNFQEVFHKPTSVIQYNEFSVERVDHSNIK